MTVPSLIALFGALLVLAWVLLMVRRGLLAEHFAAVWLGVATVCVVVALFPNLLYSATDWMHFRLPVNLLFMSAALVQLVVSVHLSVELGRRQAETRKLAEAVALLKLRIEKGAGAPPQVPVVPSPVARVDEVSVRAPGETA